MIQPGKQFSHVAPLLWLICLLWLLPVQALALDVRFVVDISERINQSDPDQLRAPTTRLLADLLPERAHAGVWTFAAQPHPLVRHGVVNTAWRAEVRQASIHMDSQAHRTDIEAALVAATWDRQQASNRARHVILLSDGLLDVSSAEDQNRRIADNDASRSRILRRLVPELAEAGFVIHTLTLSDLSDPDLMATLALRTGGQHVVAETADELMPRLMQLLNRILPSHEEVPLENDRFLIDELVDEFTALIFHAPGAEVILQSPEGQQLTAETSAQAQRWHQGSHYALVTVNQPAPGQWLILADQPAGHRVTVISDLRLHTSDWPTVVYRGVGSGSFAMQAWFTEAGQVVDRRPLLSILQASVSALRDEERLDAWLLDLQPQGYRYEARLGPFSQLGDQQLYVEIDGHTFRRQRVMAFQVMDIVGASLQQSEAIGLPPRLILRAQHPEVRPNELRFEIQANDETLSASYQGEGEWRVELNDLSRAFDQHLSVTLRGVFQGRPVVLTLPELILPGEERRLDSETLPDFVTPIDTSLVQTAETLPGWLDPLTDWNDPRIPTLLAGVAGFNFLLLLIAWWRFRRFVKRWVVQRGATKAARG